MVITWRNKLKKQDLKNNIKKRIFNIRGGIIAFNEPHFSPYYGLLFIFLMFEPLNFPILIIILKNNFKIKNDLFYRQ